MSVLSAFGIVAGIILGATTTTVVAPLFLPYTKLTANELESAKGLSIRVRGTILAVDSQYMYLRNTSEQSGAQIDMKIAYDSHSLMLVRKREMDDADQIAAIDLLTGPSDAVLRVGSDIYLTVWVTDESAPPYALAVFVTI